MASRGNTVTELQADKAANLIAKFLSAEHEIWNSGNFLRDTLIDKYDRNSGLGDKRLGQEEGEARDWCLKLYSYAARMADVPLEDTERYRVRALVKLAQNHGAFIEVEEGKEYEAAGRIRAGDALIFSRSGVESRSLGGSLHIEGAVGSATGVSLTGYRVPIVAGNTYSLRNIWQGKDIANHGTMAQYSYYFLPNGGFTGGGFESAAIVEGAKAIDKERHLLGVIDMRALIKAIGLKPQKLVEADLSDGFMTASAGVEAQKPEAVADVASDQPASEAQFPLQTASLDDPKMG